MATKQKIRKEFRLYEYPILETLLVIPFAMCAVTAFILPAMLLLSIIFDSHNRLLYSIVLGWIMAFPIFILIMYKLGDDVY